MSSPGITRLFVRHNYQEPTHRCLKCGATKNAPAFGSRRIDCPNCAKYADIKNSMEFIGQNKALASARSRPGK